MVVYPARASARARLSIGGQTDEERSPTFLSDLLATAEHCAAKDAKTCIGVVCPLGRTTPNGLRMVLQPPTERSGVFPVRFLARLSKESLRRDLQKPCGRAPINNPKTIQKFRRFKSCSGRPATRRARSAGCYVELSFKCLAPPRFATKETKPIITASGNAASAYSVLRNQ